MSTTKERAIMKDKVRLMGGPVPCLRKLIEELDEAKTEAIKLIWAEEGKANHRTMKRIAEDLARELADVQIAGLDTLQAMFPLAKDWAEKKRRAVYGEHLPRVLAGLSQEGIDSAAFAGDGDA